MEEEKDENGMPVAAGVSSAGSVQPPGMLAPAPSPGAPKSSGSGRFTNIQKYIQASGANAGGRLAGQIGQTVNKQSQKLGEAVESAKSINPQLEAERQRIAQASGFAQQVTQDPTQLTQDPSKLAAFTQLRTGRSGLNPLQQKANQAFDTAQSQLGNVQNLAKMSGTEPGRFELLRQSLGRPTYTRGQQKLDQLLLQTSGGDVLGQLQRDTAQKAKAGEELLGTSRTGIERGLGDAQQKVLVAQGLLNSTLGRLDDPSTPDIDESKDAGALGSLQQGLRQRKSDYITQQEALKKAIEGSATTDKFTDATLKAMGLTAGQNLYDVKLADLVKPTFSADNINEQNIADEQDLLKYNALVQLSGGAGSNYLNKDAIGTAQGTQVNQTNLQESLKSAQDRYKQLTTTAMNPVLDYLKRNPYLGYSGSQDPATVASFIKQNTRYLPTSGDIDYSWANNQIADAANWANKYFAMTPERRAYIEGSAAGKPLK